MTERVYEYDPVDALDSPEAIEAFMTDAFDTGDAVFIAKALGIVARAKGISRIAEETGLSREQLYRSFSERGNPTLKTLLSVARSLGLRLTAKVVVRRRTPLSAVQASTNTLRAKRKTLTVSTMARKLAKPLSCKTHSRIRSEKCADH